MTTDENDNMAELTIEAVETGQANCVMLKLTGVIDSPVINDLQKSIDDQVANGTINIIFDMSQVDYISSSGIRLMVANLDTLKSKDGMITICNPHPNVQYVLDVTGLTELFIPDAS